MQLRKLVPANHILFWIQAEAGDRRRLLVRCSANPPEVHRIRLKAQIATMSSDAMGLQASHFQPASHYHPYQLRQSETLHSSHAAAALHGSASPSPSLVVSLRGPRRVDEYGPPVRIPLVECVGVTRRGREAGSSPADSAARSCGDGELADALVWVSSLPVCILLRV
jgi:hypothetical protein